MLGTWWVNGSPRIENRERQAEESNQALAMLK